MSRPTHTHYCERCCRDVPCDMDCTFYEDDDPSQIPKGHASPCDSCVPPPIDIAACYGNGEGWSFNRHPQQSQNSGGGSP